MHDKIIAGNGAWTVGVGQLPEGPALCFWKRNNDGVVQQVMQPSTMPDFYIAFTSPEAVTAVVNSLVVVDALLQKDAM